MAVPQGFPERFRAITGLDRGEKIRPLAKHLGVSVQSIYDWKDGLSTPREEKLAKLQETYGVDPQWLLYGTTTVQEQPPETPAQLKGWVNGITSKLDGLGDYLEDVINAEVERRLEERLDKLMDEQLALLEQGQSPTAPVVERIEAALRSRMEREPKLTPTLPGRPPTKETTVAALDSLEKAAARGKLGGASASRDGDKTTRPSGAGSPSRR